MEKKIIVVSELAQRLKKFESKAARKFLREYLAYENRLDTSEAQVPLRRCLEPGDLESLLQCAEDMEGVRVLREIPADVDAARKRHIRVDIVSPIAPLNFDSDEDEDEETKVENLPADRDDVIEVLRLSNAHIEMMLVHALGPVDQTEVIEILREIKMNKEVPFTKLATATNYIQEWRDTMRWCHKCLVRKFSRSSSSRASCPENLVVL